MPPRPRPRPAHPLTTCSPAFRCNPATSFQFSDKEIEGSATIQTFLTLMEKGQLDEGLLGEVRRTRLLRRCWALVRFLRKWQSVLVLRAACYCLYQLPGVRGDKLVGYIVATSAQDTLQAAGYLVLPFASWSSGERRCAGMISQAPHSGWAWSDVLDPRALPWEPWNLMPGEDLWRLCSGGEGRMRRPNGRPRLLQEGKVIPNDFLVNDEEWSEGNVVLVSVDGVRFRCDRGRLDWIRCGARRIRAPPR